VPVWPLLRRIGRAVDALPLGRPIADAARALVRPRRLIARWSERRRRRRPFIVHPAPRPIAVTVVPPRIAEPDRITVALAGDRPDDIRFDIELLEALDREYADRPLVPVPMEYDHEALTARSIARLQSIHQVIDLADKRVLEFGCGHGYEVWLLSHGYDADAWGVDVVERAPWAQLADERTRFVLGDLTKDPVFPDASFDRIISINVLEHVQRPIEALEALHRVLRPGGLAWISANLYRGPLASHRYRDIRFPWPHLLFEDDVIREFDRRHGLPEQGAVWVNKLTWEQYRHEIERIGFVVHRERLRQTPIDEEFFRRFESVLGRYPRADLARDFFEVILERPAPRRRLRR
jgi:SAM-dependent methyltransferase